MLRLSEVKLEIGGITILDGVSFAVERGERLTVVGANGAGKSSLLRVITGFARPTSGVVTVLGREPTALRRSAELRAFRAEIGMVHQGLHLVGRLTALDNVLVGRLAHNRSIKTWFRRFDAADSEVAMAALDTVGMVHKAKQRTDSLSGGERQRIAIARAIAQQATVIIADEPTSALDPLASREIAELLARLAGELDVTLITIVHDIALLGTLGRRVIGMKEGRVVFDRLGEDLSAHELDELYERRKLL